MRTPSSPLGRPSTRDRRGGCSSYLMSSCGPRGDAADSVRLAARQCRHARHERSPGTWLPSRPPRGRWTCRVLVSVVGRVDVAGQCGWFCQVRCQDLFRRSHQAPPEEMSLPLSERSLAPNFQWDQPNVTLLESTAYSTNTTLLPPLHVTFHTDALSGLRRVFVSLHFPHVDLAEFCGFRSGE